MPGAGELRPRAAAEERSRGARLARWERGASWALLALAGLVGAVTTLDAWRDVGQVVPGFALMETLQAGPGGVGRGPFEPFDLIRAVNGREVASAAEVRAEAARHPPGTVLRYTVTRGPRELEVDMPTRLVLRRDFGRFLLDSALPGALVLAVAGLVVTLRPGAPGSRLFLVFCLTSAVTAFGYFDLVTHHRLSRLTLALWAFSPAVFAHLALTFPEPRPAVRRRPWIVAVPWGVSAVLAVWTVWNFSRLLTPAGEVVAVAWGLALLGLLASLAQTVRVGATPLVRQHARVLLAAFGLGYLLPIAGMVAEVALHVTIPGLRLMWAMSLLFPLAIGYAIVRYQLFDIQAAIRLGTIYSILTALLVLTYTGLLTGLNLVLSSLGLDAPPLAAAALVSVAVVAVVNPLYARTWRLIDRVFFRARHDAQRAIERLADELTTVLDLSRISGLLADALGGILHPSHLALLTADEGRGFRSVEGAGRRLALAGDSRLVALLARARGPITRERLGADPDLDGERAACLAEMDALDAEMVVPVVFRDRLNGLLVAGPRRGERPYSGEDVRLVRQVANQTAVVLENARAYHALEAALRRVEILESIRVSLAKFVPRAVRDLIDRAPEAPALDQRQVDVSVLFVDIAGYTRLSERLSSARVTHLVERYFGAFLDEILARGGDVNETAGDGLMVIFQDEDPAGHARAAVLTAQAILARTAVINAELAETREAIHLHLGVNSGPVALGAVRIEGLAGARWTYTASGPVTNVAARLAALSDDSVLLGAETAGRLAGTVRLQDLGPVALRNVGEPVRVFRLDGAADNPLDVRAAAPADRG